MATWRSEATSPQAPAAQGEMHLVVRDIEAVAAQDVAFCCVAMDAEHGGVEVFRVARDSSVSEDRYRSVLPKGVGIVFRAAVLNRAETKHMFDLVRDNVEWLVTRGISFNSCRSSEVKDADGNTGIGPFEIGFDGPGEPDREVLDRFSLYGPGTVTFFRGGTVSGGIVYRRKGANRD